MTAVLVVAGGLVVLVAAGLWWFQPVSTELTRRRIEKLRLQRAQLEAERRIHVMVTRAFTELLDEARRQRSS